MTAIQLPEAVRAILSQATVADLVTTVADSPAAVFAVVYAAKSALVKVQRFEDAATLNTFLDTVVPAAKAECEVKLAS